MHETFYEGRTRHFLNTTIGTAKTKRVSLPRLKPNGWIMIIHSILQVGVNSADSTEFTGPVEYLLEYKLSRLAWLLLLAKEAENASSHNAIVMLTIFYQQTPNSNKTPNRLGQNMSTSSQQTTTCQQNQSRTRVTKHQHCLHF